jgi:hypothetical protein
MLRLRSFFRRSTACGRSSSSRPFEIVGDNVEAVAAGRGKARRGAAWRGAAGQGKAVEARLGMAGRGGAWQGKAVAAWIFRTMEKKGL